MTQAISHTVGPIDAIDAIGTGDTAMGAPLHCGDPMTLRETSYRGSSYGMIAQQSTDDVELVWACACGFQLAHEDPADRALSPTLRRLAAAAADVESARWHLDQATADLEAAVLDAARSGAAIVDIAEAAQVEPGDIRQLASDGARFDQAG
ncbi:hypothetical protein PTW37_14900 [Arthrobacter agilis]|uniref:hypothetical protein n=1 Tax=Arthrobacter agilis TaxID=37921 RepID=UPI002366B77E|nr:hypothetical protein [Arthrobacter agilis]WDF33119.1 hypothetical protein PTW37_14900 [Arthrobacter agilis]